MTRYEYHGADGSTLSGTIASSINCHGFISSNRTTVSLGMDRFNQPILLDLASAPHVLVAGTTGSGKSVLLHDIILSIVMKNTPNTARFIMIDPKVVEFNTYNSLPHMLYPVCTETSDAIKRIAQAEKIMDMRYHDLACRGLRQWDGTEIYIIADELADLIMTGGKQVSSSLLRIAQKGRAAGIHLILATQQPSVKIMPSALKANCPTRIALKVKSISDSRIILDHKGAEELAGKGDAILSRSDGTEERFQAGYISPEGLDNVLAHCVSIPIHESFFDRIKGR
jgi:S-DNA-T family DNA segregation ATPase FtsK/SpoIIIE